MKLPTLYQGRLVERYKRFLVDVALQEGIVTAHCPNSGSMAGVNRPGSAVMLSRSHNDRRKLNYTLELVRVGDIWVGVNTNYPNKLVQEGIEQKEIPQLEGYAAIRREVKYGQNSRIDLLLESAGKKCYVEVKNVTWERNHTALFPDALTARGQKHLRELMKVKADGHRAVILFVVQREDCRRLAPADEIDPEYGKLLRQAKSCGVELLAYVAGITLEEIRLSHEVPINLD